MHNSKALSTPSYHFLSQQTSDSRLDTVDKRKKNNIAKYYSARQCRCEDSMLRSTVIFTCRVNNSRNAMLIIATVYSTTSFAVSSHFFSSFFFVLYDERISYQLSKFAKFSSVVHRFCNTVKCLLQLVPSRNEKHQKTRKILEETERKQPSENACFFARTKPVFLIT